MKQAKRLFYMVVLNIIISAITIGVVLQLWEKDHPPVSVATTPLVIVVTPTQAMVLPLIVKGTDTGIIIQAAETPLGVPQASPTLELLTYRVKEGDTLGALAVQFNLSLDDLMIVNNLTDPDSLYVGQLIHIPTAPLPKVTFTAIPTTAAATTTPRPSSTSTPGSRLTATPTATSQEPQVVIYTVIGVGALENERVVLRRTGNGELSLSGWWLSDGQGHDYQFPQLTLYKDGAINLNTRSGQNTVVDLFWGLSSPMWSSGKTISLYDSHNNLRATYSVP